jgi:hydroxymethylglutaryl-CoA lyase
VGCSISESIDNCLRVYELASASDIVSEAILALAFGCPLEGPIAEDKVVAIAGELIKIGFRDLSIADSVGVANPRSVKRLLRKLRQEYPNVRYSLHLHDTRGLALANILAALEEGVDTFDSSLGGLGGCPVVAGGSGNVATEDLVNMLEEMDIRTGVDLHRVMRATRRLQSFLKRDLPSRILASGTRKQLFEKATNLSRREQ